MKKFLLIWCLVCSVAAYAQENKKMYETSFPSKEVKELVVVNSSGNVSLKQTEEAFCRVVAVIVVEAKSEEKVQEALAMTRIDTAVTDGSRTFTTVLDKEMGLKKAFAGMKVQVDYQLAVPRGVRVRIVNSNGDVSVPAFAGRMDVDVNNGNITAGVLQDGECYIKQSGGDCNIERVNVLDGEFRNGNVLIGDGENIRLNLNACTGDIASAGKLNVRSSGGKMKIGDVERLIGSSSFTKYEVQDLADLLDMDMKMGEMNIRNIRPLFSEIRLKTSFTKVGLTFMDKASYALEIKHNKSLKMDLPEGLELEYAPTSERNVRIGKAQVGDAAQAGKVQLEISNGNFYLQ